MSVNVFEFKIQNEHELIVLKIGCFANGNINTINSISTYILIQNVMNICYR